MRTHRYVFVLLAAFAFAIAGCTNPFLEFFEEHSGTNEMEQKTTSATTGAIYIQLSGISNSERTVMPYSQADIATYSLSAVCTGRTEITRSETSAANLSLSHVAPGSWTISVAGKNTEGKTLYAGSATVDVAAGQSTTANISMKTAKTAAGTGTFSVVYIFPEKTINAENASITLSGYPDTALLYADKYKTTPGAQNDTLTVSSNGPIASGTYLLQLSVFLNGSEYKLDEQIVQVFDNLESTTPGKAAVVCDSTSLKNSLTQYYVSSTGTGTGRTPSNPASFADALARIHANAVVSETSPGTIILITSIDLSTASGFSITAPVLIRSLAGESNKAQITVSASGSSYGFVIGNTEGISGQLTLQDLALVPNSDARPSQSMFCIRSGRLSIEGGAYLAYSTAATGGLVHVNGTDASVHMNGGEIFECSSHKGGAFYAQAGEVILSSGIINGCTATVIGNEPGTGRAIYIAQGARISATEGSTGIISKHYEANEIPRITIESASSLPATQAEIDLIKATCEPPASADIKDAGLVLVAREATPEQIRTALAAADRVSVHIEAGSSAMGEPTIIPTTITVNNDVYFKGSGASLCGWEQSNGVPISTPSDGALLNGPIFLINADGSLTMDDVILFGSGETNEAGFPLLQIAGGNVLLSGSSKLNLNTSTAFGGGVAMSSGSLTMKDTSSISTCKAVKGGGIYMTGGVLSIADSSYLHYCVASSEGSALWVGDGEVGLHSTAEDYAIRYSFIQGNAGTAFGGLIYQQGGQITCSSVLTPIESTMTNVNGVGLYIKGGTFTLSSPGVIKNCKTAESLGGAVHVTGTSTESYGTFNMTGGTIGSNNSARKGGGLYVGEYGHVNLSGGTITGNSAGETGGGVYLVEGTLELNGTQILNNTASVNGGGIWMNAGSTPAGRVNFGPNAQESSIEGNTATSGSGGGVWNESQWINPFQLNGTESTAVDTYFLNNVANGEVNNYNTTTSGGFNETMIGTSVTVYKNQLVTFSGGIGGTTITSVSGIRKDPNLQDTAFTCSLTGTNPNQLWSYTDTEPLTIDGEYVYTFTAVIDGQNFNISRIVYYDTTAPTVNLTATIDNLTPKQGTSVNLTISDIADAGIGLHGGSITFFGTTWFNDITEQFYTGTTTYIIPITFIQSGSFNGKIPVMLQDSLGNSKSEYINVGTIEINP